MSRSIKQFYLVAILAIVLMLSFAQVPIGFTAETYSSDEVLAFLRDVASLDMNKYAVTLDGEISNYPPALGGLEQITGKYTLVSQESKVEVLYKFINNTLTYCLMDVIEGSPQYAQPKFTTISDNAENFLEKYETYIGDPGLEAYKNMLSQIDTSKNISKTVDNVKLTSTNSLISSLDWRKSFNGADYSGISISFWNGSFYAFKDDRNYYEIGGTEVNIDEEEAVNLALAYVKTFSWTVGDAEVTDYNIVEDKIRALLLTKSREPLNLYPYWLITLPLDDIYPGLVTTIQVQIWADTSEIIRCDAIPTGGEIPYDKFLETKTVESTQSSIDTVTATVAAASIIAIVIAIVTIKKKRK
ncbi:hypothetical protein JXA31_07105 [Candidatus Bathyarchaeota archaeon]|nr:hypothetical protein [Candidatus Bathyarchaeota archaeon]